MIKRVFLIVAIVGGIGYMFGSAAFTQVQVTQARHHQVLSEI